MTPKQAQIADQAVKQRDRARRIARMLDERHGAALRVIIGQLRIQHVEVDYPVDFTNCA